ncbi:Ficolin-1 [Exaiptasia diaphana]|nr:Ficolin-1 [Exaiptasia diaphana]
MVTSGGGWTVIQKRLDGSVDFFRDWAGYKKGFGNKSGEYWLGLDAIHDMTSQGSYRLRFDLEDFDGNKRYAEYDSFIVAGESDNYTLTAGAYSGNAGDSLAWQKNMEFTTKDRDNDLRSYANCAQEYTGAWWYNDCHTSNLNGLYNNTEYGKGVIWYAFRGVYYSMKRAEMKIRPNDF